MGDQQIAGLGKQLIEPVGRGRMLGAVLGTPAPIPTLSRSAGTKDRNRLRDLIPPVIVVLGRVAKSLQRGGICAMRSKYPQAP